jgi:hypothetical protein
MKTAKHIIKQTPVLGKLAKGVYHAFKGRDKGSFLGSSAYWETRYQTGGNSGVGSYGFFAEFKAEVLNEFVSRKNIPRVIEFGCGDGNQLRLAKYPGYLGFDVSSTAVSQCKKLFASDETKDFRLVQDYRDDKADLTLSLDVLYHLVEDSVFEGYMRQLFGASTRFVIIYASDMEDNPADLPPHVKHRKFTPWIQRHLPQWKLVERVPNRYPYKGDFHTGSFADFFIYEKAQNPLSL